MKRQIIYAPQTVLNNPAKTVRIFDRKLAQLISDLTETLETTKNPTGVGLAAPQISQPWRVFVIRPVQHGEVRAFVNPKIMSTTDDAGKTGEQANKKRE